MSTPIYDATVKHSRRRVMRYNRWRKIVRWVVGVIVFAFAGYGFMFALVALIDWQQR